MVGRKGSTMKARDSLLSFAPTSIVVVGAGQIGTPLAARLVALGHRATLVSRRVPKTLPAGVRHVALDAGDGAALGGLLAQTSASAVVVAANPGTYSAKAWREGLVPLHRGVVAACRRAGARLVVLENLYMHGPLDRIGPDAPMAPVSRKGEVVAALTRALEDAATDGVRVVRLRAPDFYGHGLTSAVVGEEAIRNAERGALVLVPGDADAEHAFSHRDDVVDALAMLALGPEQPPGAVFMAPSIHISPRALLDRYAHRARGAGARARVLVLRKGVLRAAGVAVPLLRELAEMAYQWTEPYRVDDSDFRVRFGIEPVALPG